LYSSSTSNAITPVAVGPKTSRSTNQEEEEMKGEEEEEETAGNARRRRVHSKQSKCSE
jgi:hypothetical protein